MARLVHEGNTKVYWADTLTDPSAPTDAEITTDATELTGQLPSDGVQLSGTRNNASVSMLDGGFTPEEVGTWGRQITLNLLRDDTDDVGYTTFTYATSGYLIISRFGVPEENDEVEVYPASCHEPLPAATAENEYQQYEVQLAVTDTPSLRATVASST